MPKSEDYFWRENSNFPKTNKALNQSYFWREISNETFFVTLKHQYFGAKIQIFVN